MSIIKNKKKISCIRFTFSFPKDVAQYIEQIPSQQRSQEITTIIKEEIARREFLKNLNKMRSEKPILPKNYTIPSIPERFIEKDIVGK